VNVAIGESIVPIAVTLHVISRQDVVRLKGNALNARTVSGVIFVTGHVTYQRVKRATRRTVVVWNVMTDIGDRRVTRNVTQLV